MSFPKAFDDFNSDAPKALESVFFEGKDEEFIKVRKGRAQAEQPPRHPRLPAPGQLCPGTRDMVSAAEHDEIYLDVDVKELLERATDEQLIDLHRCGVRAGDNGLAMFV
jgi:hypothetical protein